MAEKTVGEHVETIRRHAQNMLALKANQVDAQDKIYLTTVIYCLADLAGKKGKDYLSRPLYPSKE